jgi:hypothetical protein
VWLQRKQCKGNRIDALTIVNYRRLDRQGEHVDGYLEKIVGSITTQIGPSIF